jgi:hypothetical protein
MKIKLTLICKSILFILIEIFVVSCSVEPDYIDNSAQQRNQQYNQQPQYQQPSAPPNQYYQSPQYAPVPQQQYYQSQQVPYSYGGAPASRFYSNPYDVQPMQQYRPYYDADQYYVPPTKYNNVELQPKASNGSGPF